VTRSGRKVRDRKKIPQRKQLKKVERLACPQRNRPKYNRHHLNPRSKISDLKSKILKIIEEERKNSFFSPTEQLLYSMLKQGEAPHRGLERVLRQTKKVLLTVHEAWNKVFGGDIYAWDAIKRVESLAHNGLDTLTDNQKQAWNLLFGHATSFPEVIDIIKERWSPNFPPIGMMLKIARKERRRKK